VVHREAGRAAETAPRVEQGVDAVNVDRRVKR
jgi:hypothetical protein